MNKKQSKFRLVAEMEGGHVFGVKLSEEQTEKLNRVLENILPGKVQIHHTAFGTNEDLFPRAITNLEEEVV